MQAMPTLDVVLSGFPRMSEQPVTADRDARSPSREGFMVETTTHRLGQDLTAQRTGEARCL